MSDTGLRSMGRRGFLQRLALGLGAGPLGAMGGRTLAAAARRPNIVFILADDMGYGDMRCNHADCKVPTPNLDRLARMGMRFTDAHSPSAVCSPTRYSILTGRYSWRGRLKSGVLGPWAPPLIEEDRLTVAKFLKQHGYRTACIGKWHLGWDWPTTDGERPANNGGNVAWGEPVGGGPLAAGFDHYFGDGVPNYPPYCYIEDDRCQGVPSEQKPDSMFGNPGPMLPGWDLEAVLPEITRRTARYIRDAADREEPFFLYFPLTAPHTPIAPNEQFRGSTEAGAYGDWVAEVDWCVGQVMDALEETGQFEDTLVIFCSDNGSPARDGTDMSGPLRSVERYGHIPNAPYRGIKTNIWDGGHRGPFIAAWPGTIPAGAVCDETICHVDFMGTLADLLDAELPENAAEDSFSLLPALLEEGHAEPLRGPVVHHSGSGEFALRDGRWKLILCEGSGGWLGGGPADAPPIQLYDMAGDPAEEYNLYAERPDKVEELTAILPAIVERGRSTPGPPQPQVEPVRFMPPLAESADETGSFDLVRHCAVRKHPQGMVIQSGRVGFALRKIEGEGLSQHVWTFRCQSVSEGGSRNCLFVLGEEPYADELLKCGTLFVAGSHAIWRGTWDEWDQGVTAEHSLEPTAEIAVRVALDTKRREVTMRVAGQALRAALPKSIETLRYYGWLVNGTKTLIMPLG